MFDLQTAEDLFAIVDFRFDEYCTDEKDTEDIVAIIMMTNHLREWIAPGYKPTNGKWPVAKTLEEEFSRRVYDHPNFEIIRHLCNGTKHGKSTKVTTAEFHHPEISSIPTAHLVDGQPIEDVISPIMELYRAWFSGTWKP